MVLMISGGVVPKLEPAQFPYFGMGKGAFGTGCLMNELKKPLKYNTTTRM
ncbi:Uncharacterised protein [Legionella pneumophila]|nr:Uncharacterised protein [Legionella pneumophila]